MRTQLPFASYLFILRRHIWLVLGFVVVVLAAGWWYGRSQVSIFKSVATLEIIPRGRDPADTRAGLLGEDPLFVNNQVYRLRTDSLLADRVADHLRSLAPGSPAEGSDPARDIVLDPLKSIEPREPPLPPGVSFAGTTGSSLRGRVSVTAVPGTTYYDFAVTGTDLLTNYALVNAYARVFADVFRDERHARFLDSIRTYQASLDAARNRLSESKSAIADFKKAHPRVDFSGDQGGAAEKNADSMKRLLQEKQTTLLVLKREQMNIDETLAAVGLKIQEHPRLGHLLEPPLPPMGPVDQDPRLSALVQSLDVVARDPGVERARLAIEGVDAKILALETGTGRLKEDAPEITAIRDGRVGKVQLLAQSTEAALLKHARHVAEIEGVVADWSKDVTGEGERATEEAVARAELERLQKKAAAVKEERDAASKLIFDAETQRKRYEEGGGSVRIHAYAQPGAVTLVSPNRPVIYLGTVVLAILLAAALAYVLEFLDDTVKTREDFDRLVRLPFLGFVPHLPMKDGEVGGRDLYVARGKTGTPEVEAFRALRTGIQFSRPGMEVRTLLVTSAGPNEGKTTIAVNLATTFTGGKGRVLLVDADLRRARVHKALGVSNDRGLTNVLVGETTVAEAVQRSTVPGLDLLSSGPIPPNPAEVLGSERMQQVLHEVAAMYDRVIVDSPPLVAVTDPALLAKYVDAVFLVICIGKTSIRTISRAQETLSAVGVTIHGAILNNADVRVAGYAGYYGGYAYRYGYGYGYGSTNRQKGEPKESEGAKST